MRYEPRILCNQKEIEGLDPARTAHLCIDVQPLYFDVRAGRMDEQSGQEALSVAQGIAGLKRLFHMAGLAATYMIYHIGAGAAFFVVEASEEAGDVVLPKKRFSAFDGTDLDSGLRRAGIENLLLSGGYAFQCVARTACDALDRRYNVFILTDCIFTTKKNPGTEMIRDHFASYAGGGRVSWPHFTTGAAILQRFGYAPSVIESRDRHLSP